jgi:ketose-bisphosphate aldolase
MALVTMKEMLDDARQRKYAIGAFDVCNYEMIKALVDVAEELNSPVILSALMPDLAGDRLDYFMAMANVAAQKAGVPVCIHYDHAEDFGDIKRAIDIGFTSVMYDGSKQKFDDNAANTKQVCDYAKKFGVTVEAELGYVTDVDIDHSETRTTNAEETHDANDTLTNAKEVEKFIEVTGVDALAVAIGTAHGIYKSEPKLDFDRLKEINDISSVPLVLHGGSGTPDEGIKKTIQMGICKINIFSEIIIALNTELKRTLENINMRTWPIEVFRKPTAAMEKVMREKIILFGSDNKA